MKRPVLGVLVIFFVPSVVGCCLCRPNPPVGPPDKYAVLASTWQATPNVDTLNNTDFWYDLVLNYCTLIEKGFEADNIYVLYGDGQDFSSGFDAYTAPFCGDSVWTITDIPITNPSGEDKANLCNVLCCLSTGHPAKIVSGNCACKESGAEGVGGFSCLDPHAIPRLGERDFLFTWIRGHGRTDVDGITKMTFYSGSVMNDGELAGLFKKLRSSRRVLFFETCDAYGLFEEFLGDGITVAVSSAGETGVSDSPYESSYLGTYKEKDTNNGGFDLINHGRFSYWINAAFRETDLMENPIPSETDDNNLVSIEEGYDAAQDKIEVENAMSDYGGPMHPAIAAPEDIAPCIFIRLPVPGNDHDVFSMDHPEDDGTIHSEIVGAVPLAKPDLWVTYSEEGGTEHQPPKTYSDNYIHARIHNIGCADPGKVTVRFFWASGDKPDDWQYIGEDFIDAPLVGIPESATTLWSIKGELEPDESPYWLIATLDAGDDSPKESKAIEKDNNKVRIKTDVIP